LLARVYRSGYAHFTPKRPLSQAEERSWNRASHLNPAEFAPQERNRVGPPTPQTTAPALSSSPFSSLIHVLLSSSRRHRSPPTTEHDRRCPPTTATDARDPGHPYSNSSDSLLWPDLHDSCPDLRRPRSDLPPPRRRPSPLVQDLAPELPRDGHPFMANSATNSHCQPRDGKAQPAPRLPAMASHRHRSSLAGASLPKIPRKDLSAFFIGTSLLYLLYTWI
jgi:hypothetical protein